MPLAPLSLLNQQFVYFICRIQNWEKNNWILIALSEKGFILFDKTQMASSSDDGSFLRYLLDMHNTSNKLR